MSYTRMRQARPELRAVRGLERRERDGQALQRLEDLEQQAGRVLVLGVAVQVGIESKTSKQFMTFKDKPAF